jgi:polyphosphate kinase
MSWLSFNYRVLMEASDTYLPVYDRIRFLSIYSSNLEEFYAVRVSEHRTDIIKKNRTSESAETSEERLENITREVNRQQQEFYKIFHQGIIPELKKNNIVLYQDHTEYLDIHKKNIRDYFREEIFPFLTPVTLHRGAKTFIRDHRLYLVAGIRHKTTREKFYILIKIPFSKVPRFIELPQDKGVYYYIFIDDMIRENLPEVFPDFEPEGCYSIKISRDADILVDDTDGIDVKKIREKVGKRKVGALIRFMHDREMPSEMLDFLCSHFEIGMDDLIIGGRYMNLQDMAKFPNPTGISLVEEIPEPQRVSYLDNADSLLNIIDNQDVFLFFPYQSFDYVIRFLDEAAEDDTVEEIKITQYRVAENSAVVDLLIKAAQRGKKVTVFVEVKARFDEENNVVTAELMEQAGIHIIYSIKGLKVHAKTALVVRKSGFRSIAFASTGNFNEKTARIYSDMALLTAENEIVEDVAELFRTLENPVSVQPVFKHLLVASFNMVEEINRLINREKENVNNGNRGYIILKMNGLHDKAMIDNLYLASEAGVEIDLIIRGICCIVPNQPYSRNIHITRIVDMFLEHARVWYFYNGGKEDVYITSADWMRRNLSRRIEIAVPVLSPVIKREIIDILHIQLQDNVKACTIDENLNNIYKRNDLPKIRSQAEIYGYIRK